MLDSGFTFSQWRTLNSTERKILHYFRIMKMYHIEFSPERIKMREEIKKAEQKKCQQEVLGKMPRMARILKRIPGR